MLWEVSLTNATFNSQLISIGALGLISRLNIGALELGDYLGKFITQSINTSVAHIQFFLSDSCTS